MRKKKIRGHKRLQKRIESWRLYNLSLDLNDYLFHTSDRYYAKIRVHPWSGLSLINSIIPEPTRKTKRIILSALLDIYNDWKIQLDELGQPYYLKIWLFEPRFSSSQVVCAIGESLDFYNTTFAKPEKQKSFNPKSYGKLSNLLEQLNWEQTLDDDLYFDDEILPPERYASIEDYEESKIWFNRLKKKPHRTEKIFDGTMECYLFNRGNVWLGSQI